MSAERPAGRCASSWSPLPELHVPLLSQLGVTFPWHQAMSRVGGSSQA